MMKVTGKRTSANPFQTGDVLRYTGYATTNNQTLESARIEQSQSANENISLYFTPPTVLPTIVTTTISAITSNSALCGGNITSDGGASITARGVCWSTSQNPTIADSNTNDGTGAGSFTSSLTNLTAGTTYYVRAYATNSVGTSYGA